MPLYALANQLVDSGCPIKETQPWPKHLFSTESVLEKADCLVIVR